MKTEAIEQCISNNEAADARAELAALKTEITRLRAELEIAWSDEHDPLKDENARLRALLASGQCVDLARVTDDALYTAAHEAYVMAGFDHRSDARFSAEFRKWLVEKAGVKS